eukprot:s824_g11.t1
MASAYPLRVFVSSQGYRDVGPTLLATTTVMIGATPPASGAVEQPQILIIPATVMAAMDVEVLGPRPPRSKYLDSYLKNSNHLHSLDKYLRKRIKYIKYLHECLHNNWVHVLDLNLNLHFNQLHDDRHNRNSFVHKHLRHDSDICNAHHNFNHNFGHGNAVVYAELICNLQHKRNSQLNEQNADRHQFY